MCIQNNLNYQFHFLLGNLYNDTHKILQLTSDIWTPQYFYFCVSYGQFGLSSTVMILGPNQYYCFIDNTMLECIPFLMCLSY